MVVCGLVKAPVWKNTDLSLLVAVVSCVSSFQEVKVKGCSDVERFSEYEACVQKCEEF